jgi:hypothetical protein
MSDGQIGAVNGIFSVWSSILRRPGRSADITPSAASRPSPVIHDRSFVRFDEILDLVENGIRPHPRPAPASQARGPDRDASPSMVSLRPSHCILAVSFGACTSPFRTLCQSAYESVITSL